MTKKPLLASLLAAEEGVAPEGDRPMVKPKFGTSSAAVGNIGKGFALQSEGRVIDIDPGLVAPSPFADRLEMDEAALSDLVASILAEGQRMPVLARPHPTESGRYQLAYGHRRLRAVQRIRENVQGKEGLQLKAFVAPLTDIELAERQASENIDRQDLSWIDQALFLAGLEAGGGEVKGAAEKILKIDRSVAWRMRNVMATIPGDVVRGIGSARKIGMPRWVALAELFEKAPAKATAAASAMIERLDTAESAAGATASAGRSDKRFLAVFNAVKKATEQSASPSSRKTGATVVKVSKTSIEVRFPREQAQFGAWFEAEFPALWEKFLASTKS